MAAARSPPPPPRQYSNMIIFCFGTALSLYIPLVFIAYLTYGHEVRSTPTAMRVR